MTRLLAERLKKGIALDNLHEAIPEFDRWSQTRPDVGGPIVDILRRIQGRWTGYELPTEEYRLVADTVVPRVLDILRRLDEEPGYQPVHDLGDLRRAYDALN